MGASKNDQVTILNVKPQYKINYLLREIEKLKIEIIELKEKINKLNDINNRTIDEDKPDSINL